MQHHQFLCSNHAINLQQRIEDTHSLEIKPNFKRYITWVSRTILGYHNRLGWRQLNIVPVNNIHEQLFVSVHQFSIFDIMEAIEQSWRSFTSSLRITATFGMLVLSPLCIAQNRFIHMLTWSTRRVTPPFVLHTRRTVVLVVEVIDLNTPTAAAVLVLPVPGPPWKLILVQICETV
jgi:hypothetical protein